MRSPIFKYNRTGSRTHKQTKKFFKTKQFFNNIQNSIYKDLDNENSNLHTLQCLSRIAINIYIISNLIETIAESMVFARANILLKFIFDKNETKTYNLI